MSVSEPHTSGVYVKFSVCLSHTSCRIYAHYSIYAHDSIYAHLEYRIMLMHAAVRSCTDMVTSSTVHEQSKKREASKTARTRAGPHRAFDTAAEREARFVERPELCSHCYCGLDTA